MGHLDHRRNSLTDMQSNLTVELHHETLNSNQLSIQLVLLYLMDSSDLWCRESSNCQHLMFQFKGSNNQQDIRSLCLRRSMDNSTLLGILVPISDRLRSILQEHTYHRIVGNRLSNRWDVLFQLIQCRRNLQHSLL